LLFLGALIGVLSLGVYPHSVRQDWSIYRQSVQDGVPGRAYLAMARLAAHSPWRDDLQRLAGLYAFEADQPTAAISHLNQVDADSLTGSDWLILGDAYLANSDAQKAVQAWERSFSKDASEAALDRLMIVYQAQDDHVAMIQTLKNKLQIKPGDADTAYRLGLLLAAEEPQAALVYLDLAANSGQAYGPDSARVLEAIRTALVFDQPAFHLVSAGKALAELPNWPLAKRAFENATQTDPNYAEGWAFLGEALQQLEPEANERALEYLEYSLSIAENSVVGVSLTGLYWQRQGDYERATTYFRRAALLEPDNPAWAAALGSLENAQGNLGNAEAYFREATRLAERDSQYWRLLAGFYLSNQIQLREKALPAAVQAVALDADNPANLDLLGQVYIQIEKLGQAEDVLLKALRLQPDYAPAMLHLSLAYLYQEQIELARFYLQQALEANDAIIQEQARRLLGYFYP
jgi:tetratricopeptide (TPR) repeat protein